MRLEEISNTTTTSLSLSFSTLFEDGPRFCKYIIDNFLPRRHYRARTMHTRMLHEVEGRGTVYKQAGGALLKEEGERRRPLLRRWNPWPSPLFVVWLVDLGAYHDLPSKRARFLQLTRKNGRCWAYIFIFRGRIGSSRELLKRPELLSLPPPYTSPPCPLYLFLRHRLSYPEPIKRSSNEATFVRV